MQDQLKLAQAAVCPAATTVQTLFSPQILFCRAGSHMSQESYSHDERERISLAAAQASQDSQPTKST